MIKSLKFIPNQTLVKLISIFLITVFLISMWWWAKLPVLITQSSFKSRPIELNTYDLFDLGAVDVDGDSNLDIFTTNHSALQSLLLNQTQGEFIDKFSELKLSQDLKFEDIEVAGSKPNFSDPGLYIYRRKNFQWNTVEADNLLVLSIHKVDRPVVGTIELISPIKTELSDGFSIQKTEKQLAADLVLTTIDFTAVADGKLFIESDLTALPIKFKIDRGISAEQIFLGQKLQQPETREFSLHWKDRHGMAWVDFNGDRFMDVFVSRGGLKGKIERFLELDLRNFLQDELFANTGNSFADNTVEKEIHKNSCPGRQVAWVDYNNDNRLDLYVVCGKGAPPGALSPNQLHQQQADGTFIDVAPQLELAHLEGGSFVWLDSDLDGDLDLFWATKEQFQLYLNQNNQFEPQLPIVKSRATGVEKLAVADIDRDGDLDIYAAQSKKSLILENNNGTYKTIEPKSLGLPTAVITANWVDYDNDGLVDLYALPGGIYRQKNNGKFLATHLLKPKFSLSEFDDARSTWFDYDNDGRRDLLVAYKYRPWWLRIIGKVKTDIPDPRSWQARLYQNIGNSNHWLEIALTGSLGNPQAIGSRVTVITDDGKQIQQVGQADGSHYSQGHYRLYFGLGQQKPKQILVEWSNGQTQTLINPASDRLLTIEQPHSKQFQDEVINEQ